MSQLSRSFIKKKNFFTLQFYIQNESNSYITKQFIYRMTRFYWPNSDCQMLFSFNIKKKKENRMTLGVWIIVSVEGNMDKMNLNELKSYETIRKSQQVRFKWSIIIKYTYYLQYENKDQKNWGWDLGGW